MPLLVRTCCGIVEERGLEVVGVYRVPGNSAAVNHLTEQVNRGEFRSVSQSAVSKPPYRVTHLRRTWVGLTLILHVPPAAWAVGKLAELAEQLAKMVEHPKSKSTQSRFDWGCFTLYIIT